MSCRRLVILAAGRGTRLQESASATDLPAGIDADQIHDARHRPKPLMHVSGKPLLIHLLRRADRAGFTHATLVLGAADKWTRQVVRDWNETPAGPRMHIVFVVQPMPLGTAHAVEQALRADRDVSGEDFVVCNGDNVPTTAALRTIRTQPGNAIIGFDPTALRLPVERVQAFAVCQADAEGELVQIIEKPTPAQVAQMPRPLVSMNLMKLPTERMLSACSECPPHPERGERELPMVLQSIMVQALDGSIDVVPMASPVVDVTRLHDIPQAEATLALDNPKMLFEVCASTPEDAEVAAAGGADRLELCAHWPCGGLTPPDADVLLAARAGLPVHALIRPRAGHFVYTEEEKAWMVDQTHAALRAGASRAVIGASLPSGRLDLPWLEAMATTFGGHQLVVHRAIDLTPKIDSDARALAALGISRVLTSGGAQMAMDGRARIEQLIGLGFQVVVGSGVRPGEAGVWSALGAEAVHASCRTAVASEIPLFDGTTHPVDGTKVAAFVRSLRSCV